MTAGAPDRAARGATVKPERPKLRAEVSEADLVTICELIAAGSTYAAASMAAGVRPSALRFLKRADPAVARRLRLAWQEQARRLLDAARAALLDAAGGQQPRGRS